MPTTWIDQVTSSLQVKRSTTELSGLFMLETKFFNHTDAVGIF